MIVANKLALTCTFIILSTRLHILSHKSLFDSCSTFNGPLRRNGNCHRVLRYAYEHPPPSSERNAGSLIQRQLINEIYKGFFEHGEDIADFDNLARYCETVGLMTRENVSRIRYLSIWYFFSQSLAWDTVNRIRNTRTDPVLLFIICDSFGITYTSRPSLIHITHLCATFIGPRIPALRPIRRGSGGDDQRSARGWCIGSSDDYYQ